MTWSRCIAVCAFLPLAAWAEPPAKKPRPAPPPMHSQLTLQVHQPVDFDPGFLPASVICDDLAVVRVDGTSAKFKVEGLKEGSTLCSFTSLTEPDRRHLVDVTVTR